MRLLIWNACLGLGLMFSAEYSFAQSAPQNCQALLGPAGTRLMPSALTAEHFVCILKGLEGEAAPPEFQNVAKFNLPAIVIVAPGATATAPAPAGISYADGKLTWTVVLDEDATNEIKAASEKAMQAYFKRALEAADRLEQANLTALLSSAKFVAVIASKKKIEIEVDGGKEQEGDDGKGAKKDLPKARRDDGAGTTMPCCGNFSVCCARDFQCLISRFFARFRGGYCGTLCVRRPVSCGTCIAEHATSASPVLAAVKQEPTKQTEAVAARVERPMGPVIAEPRHKPQFAANSLPTVRKSASSVGPAVDVQYASKAAVAAVTIPKAQPASFAVAPEVVVPTGPVSRYLLSEEELRRLMALKGAQSASSERKIVLGRSDWSSGNYQAALVHFDEAVRSAPQSPIVWSFRAICLLSLGDELAATQAIHQASRLLEKSPADRSLLYQHLERVQGGIRLRFESLLRFSAVNRSPPTSSTPLVAGRL